MLGRPPHRAGSWGADRASTIHWPRPAVSKGWVRPVWIQQGVKDLFPTVGSTDSPRAGPLPCVLIVAGTEQDVQTIHPSSSKVTRELVPIPFPFVGFGPGLTREKESQSMDMEEPSLMDVAHDTRHSTRGPGSERSG